MNSNGQAVVFCILSTELWVRCEWGPSSGRKGLASSTLAELAGEQGYGCTPNAWASTPGRAVYASGHHHHPAHFLAHSESPKNMHRNAAGQHNGPPLFTLTVTLSKNAAE